MTYREPVTTTEHTYLATFEPADEGGYIVRFPSLPGLVTEGETLDDARAMAADALRCLIEGHLEDGLPIPPSDGIVSEAERERAATHKLRTA